MMEYKHIEKIITGIIVSEHEPDYLIVNGEMIPHQRIWLQTESGKVYYLWLKNEMIEKYKQSNSNKKLSFKIKKEEFYHFWMVKDIFN